MPIKDFTAGCEMCGKKTSWVFYNPEKMIIFPLCKNHYKENPDGVMDIAARVAGDKEKGAFCFVLKNETFGSKEELETLKDEIKQLKTEIQKRDDFMDGIIV